jgi:pyrophosphatase PpaX
MSDSNYRSMLFDLDGTLIDTADHIVVSLRFAFEKYLGWSPDEPALISGIGTPLDGQLRMHAEPRLGHVLTEDALTEMRDTYIDHNLATHDDVVQAFPGVAEVLSQLQDRGIRMGIVTSKPVSTAQRGLRVSGLDGFFGPIIGCDSVVNHKPHPEPVYRALEAVEMTAEEVLFVGDSPWDIVAGRRASVDTGAALWGPFDTTAFSDAPPIHWLEEFPQLLDL